jgi:Polysaccharide lyase
MPPSGAAGEAPNEQAARDNPTLEFYTGAGRNLMKFVAATWMVTALLLAGAGAGAASDVPAQGTCTAIDVHDGFEGPTLSRLWQTILVVPSALRIQSRVVRAGHSAAEITVQPRDNFERGVQGDSDSERDELLEASRLVPKGNCAYEYSFSMFVPRNFPIVPTRLVIAQWKQYCPDHRSCFDDSPVLAIRYMSNVLRITQNIGKKYTIQYQKKSEFRNRWLDFKFKVRFSAGEEGRIEAWLNNKRVLNYSGITANPENAKTGYPSPSHFYFKMGLYRNVMHAPMTIYIDEYRKQYLPRF